MDRRYKKDPSLRMTSNVCFRITPFQKERLYAYAKEHNKSLSDSVNDALDLLIGEDPGRKKSSWAKEKGE